jgi:hypothetical protein
MSTPETIEELKKRFLKKRVVVVAADPILARFRGRMGTVKGVTFNRRILVQFDGEDRSWYDLPPEVLQVTEAVSEHPDPSHPRSEGART